MTKIEAQKKRAAEAAAKFIGDGMILGLGTGSTARYLILRVAEMIAGGMNLKAVATSSATEKLAVELKIPVLDIGEAGRIDLDIDGVDEIDRDFSSVKGGGGALFREKLVALRSREVIWIMDGRKFRNQLGGFPLPIEVLPFGLFHVRQEIKAMGYEPVLRGENASPYVTDNGCYILDVHRIPAGTYSEASMKIKDICGVLETGFFGPLCSRVVIGTEQGARIISRNLISGENRN